MFARMLSIQFASGPNAGAACTDETSADVASWRQHSDARLGQEAAPKTPPFGAWGVGADGRLSSRLLGGFNTQQRPDSLKRYQQEANPNAAACWHHRAGSTPSHALASCTGEPRFDEGGREVPHSGRCEHKTACEQTLACDAKGMQSTDSGVYGVCLDALGYAGMPWDGARERLGKSGVTEGHPDQRIEQIFLNGNHTGGSLVEKVKKYPEEQRASQRSAFSIPSKKSRETADKRLVVEAARREGLEDTRQTVEMPGRDPSVGNWNTNAQTNHVVRAALQRFEIHAPGASGAPPSNTRPILQNGREMKQKESRELMMGFAGVLKKRLDPPWASETPSKPFHASMADLVKMNPSGSEPLRAPTELELAEVPEPPKARVVVVFAAQGKEGVVASEEREICDKAAAAGAAAGQESGAAAESFATAYSAVLNSAQSGKEYADPSGTVGWARVRGSQQDPGRHEVREERQESGEQELLHRDLVERATGRVDSVWSGELSGLDALSRAGSVPETSPAADTLHLGGKLGQLGHA